MKTYKVEVEFEEGTNGYRIPRMGKETLEINSYDRNGVDKVLGEKYGKDNYHVVSISVDVQDAK